VAIAGAAVPIAGRGPARTILNAGLVAGFVADFVVDFIADAPDGTPRPS
jgi:hypothetical protein